MHAVLCLFTMYQRKCNWRGAEQQQHAVLLIIHCYMSAPAVLGVQHWHCKAEVGTAKHSLNAAQQQQQQ